MFNALGKLILSANISKIVQPINNRIKSVVYILLLKLLHGNVLKRNPRDLDDLLVFCLSAGAE